MDKLKPCPCCGAKEPIVTLVKANSFAAVICSSMSGGCGITTSTYASTKDAIKAWNNRASGWIPCSERLPDDYKKVLIYGRETGVLIGFFTSYKNLYISDNGNTATRSSAITHWTPLPEPPVMDGGNENDT